MAGQDGLGAFSPPSILLTSQLEILELLVQRAPRQLAKCMPDIIPVMAEAIWDTKADVKKAARAALTNVCQLVSNKDIEKVR